MTGARRAQSQSRRRAQSLLRRVISTASILLVASVAAAFAATGLTIGSAASSKLGERIAINAQGRTLYTLSGETEHHFKCKSAECLRKWPPIRVSSRKEKLHAGAGLHGRLGFVRRPDGSLQLTIRGLPVYRYSGDEARGEVNGEGIEAFGGIWHAVAAGGASKPAPITPAPTPEYPAPHY